MMILVCNYSGEVWFKIKSSITKILEKRILSWIVEK